MQKNDSNPNTFFFTNFIFWLQFFHFEKFEIMSRFWGPDWEKSFKKWLDSKCEFLGKINEKDYSNPNPNPILNSIIRIPPNSEI